MRSWKKVNCGDFHYVCTFLIRCMQGKTLRVGNLPTSQLICCRLLLVCGYRRLQLSLLESVMGKEMLNFKLTRLPWMQVRDSLGDFLDAVCWNRTILVQTDGSVHKMPYRQPNSRKNLSLLSKKYHFVNDYRLLTKQKSIIFLKISMNNRRQQLTG